MPYLLSSMQSGYPGIDGCGSLYKSVQSGWLFKAFFVVQWRIKAVTAVDVKHDRALAEFLCDPGNVEKQRAVDAAGLELS